MVGAGSTEENKLKQYAVYWRNPISRKFEAIPGANVLGLSKKGIPLEISPTPLARWYTIVRD